MEFDEFVKDKDNEKKVRQYVAWLLYQIGFSGIGTTDLDVKPDFDMPELPENIKQELIEEGKKIAKFRWKSWNDTVEKELGEDRVEYRDSWTCPKLG